MKLIRSPTVVAEVIVSGCEARSRPPLSPVKVQHPFFEEIGVVGAIAGDYVDQWQSENISGPSKLIVGRDAMAQSGELSINEMSRPEARQAGQE